MTRPELEREAAGPLPPTPEAYVSCDAPPFLIAHGDSDTLIPIDHADQLQTSFVIDDTAISAG